ncbi:MAG: acyl-CoA dehydrogenase family protein [Sphingorhabdus sp.]
MRLELGEEQVMLQSAFRKFFEQECTIAVVRAAEQEGISPRYWQSVAQMGLLTLRQSGEATLLDAMVCAEEIGRAIAPGPIIETTVVAGLLERLGYHDLAQSLASGAIVASLALTDADQSRTQLITGGAYAEIVVARAGQDILVYRKGKGQHRSDLGSGAIAEWDLDRSNIDHRIGSGAETIGQWNAALEEWHLLMANALVGLASRALELGADYARQRVQFGRPIGSFQAIAHPLAESLTDVEGARLLLWRTLWSIARQKAGASGMVLLSFWFAAQTAEKAVARALHTLGGYGLSLEYDVQLYHRRALSWPLIAGDPRDALILAADRLWRGAEVSLPNIGELSIDFDLGDKAANFADQARQFFKENLTPELKEHAHHSWEGHHPAFQQQLAKAGLLFPDMPPEYGGQERDAYEMTALAEVFNEFDWTRHAIAVASMVVKTVLMYGNESLKAEVLPKLSSGEAIASFGFSEPSAGSDVFAARTKAERDGNGWRINGQKMFTSGADIAQYVLLLTRTDAGSTKHHGLSIFLVPLDTPGIEVQAVHTLSDERTNITYYTDVYVDDRYRLGDVDQGAKVMASALTMEQGATDYHLRQLAMVNAAVSWAKDMDETGARPIDQPHVAERLAQALARAYVGEALSRRALWATVEGKLNRYFGPMSKLYATEAYLNDATDLLRLAAPHSLFGAESGVGVLELDYRHGTATTIYGGTSEIMRSVIAETALGLPRAR